MAHRGKPEQARDYFAKMNCASIVWVRETFKYHVELIQQLIQRVDKCFEQVDQCFVELQPRMDRFMF